MLGKFMAIWCKAQWAKIISACFFPLLCSLCALYKIYPVLSVDFKILTFTIHVCWADIPQILQEAKTRWLRPSEICEILRNYKRFKLNADPPYKPAGMIIIYADHRSSIKALSFAQYG